MKKTIVLVMLLVCACTSFAQEEPIPPKRSRAMKVGLFGGFTPGWLSVDLKSVNEFLVGGKGAPLNTGGMFMVGGGGAIYILVIPNVRVGGMGMSGSLKSTSLDAAGIRRDAQYSVGFGGVTFEYVFPFGERLDVALGTMLGTGNATLTLRTDAGGSNTWTGERDYFGAWPATTPNNSIRTLSGSFFVFIPSLNVEYAVLAWLGVRLGVSYVGMAGPSWQVNSNQDLLGVPSSVSGRGFMLNAGIFVGTY